jgi:DNA-binding transcriptional ArsR family regulator
MKDGPDISHMAALIGDPARANILTALMSGKALTASELAVEAGVTRQTASTHLGKLLKGRLLAERKQGRHKYFSLASDDVAKVLEGLMGLAAGAGHLRTRTGPRDAALKKARVCYNHLAGEMGTQLYDMLAGKGYLKAIGENLHLTDPGSAAMRSFGIDLDGLSAARTPLCRECLDWSERRSHLAGSLGRAILARIEARDWARPIPETRVIAFSPGGEKAFQAWLTAL